MPRLRIGDLEPRLPIIQGGMSVGISLSGLASAVANEGGIGVIGAASIGMLEPDFDRNFRAANKRALRKEIRRARELTDGIIGVNIMVALSDFEDMVRVAVEEKVDLIFLGAGLLLKCPRTLLTGETRDLTTKIIPIVSSARATRIIFNSWAKRHGDVPDAVVVEGPKAGGHLGFKREQLEDPKFSLEKIVPEVIETIRRFEDKFNKQIPVIAAGGIFTGADMLKFFRLGASGVQMATRFVATHECDASIEFKKAYIECKKDDIVIIDSPVGLPGRAIKNDFLEAVAAGKKMPFKCHWKCLRTCDYRKAPYCIDLALTNAKKGNLKEGFAFAGTNAYRVDRIVSVKELVLTLLKEYEEALNA